MSMSIHADIDAAAFDIQAAVAKLPPNVRRLMTSANINLAGKKITTAEIDRQLASSSLSTLSRLELKVGLARSGILD